MSSNAIFLACVPSKSQPSISVKVGYPSSIDYVKARKNLTIVLSRAFSSVSSSATTDSRIFSYMAEALDCTFRTFNAYIGIFMATFGAAFNAAMGAALAA